MKRALLAGAAALAMMASSQVYAQSVTTTVQLAPEQRTKIKEYVVKEKVRPVTIKEKVTVGARLPADIELHTVPADWGPSVSRYRYVYSDDRVHFVDPTSRSIVYSID